jgi:hypothetical protein
MTTTPTPPFPSTALPPIPPALSDRPRRIKRKNWSGMIGLWVLRLFLLPHTLVGLGAAGAAIAFPFFILIGTNHTAQITDTRYYTSTSKGKTTEHFELTYAYDLHGLHRTGTHNVEEAYFNQLGGSRSESLEKPHYGTATVRGLGTPPLYYDQLIEPTDNLWFNWGGILLFASFWNGILSVFLYSAYFQPWRVRRLYRNGQVGFGVITEKFRTTGKNRTNYLKYEFFTEDQQKGTGKMPVADQSAYDAAFVGQNVIVLHKAGKAKPSILYDCGGYICPE